MTEEDEEFERIASKCKETERVNKSKWNSEMCSNYGGFCKKEWVGLTNKEVDEIYESTEKLVGDHWDSGGTRLMFPTTLYKAFEDKLKELNK